MVWVLQFSLQSFQCMISPEFPENEVFEELIILKFWLMTKREDIEFCTNTQVRTQLADITIKQKIVKPDAN